MKLEIIHFQVFKKQMFEIQSMKSCWVKRYIHLYTIFEKTLIISFIWKIQTS